MIYQKREIYNYVKIVVKVHVKVQGQTVIPFYCNLQITKDRGGKHICNGRNLNFALKSSAHIIGGAFGGYIFF